MGGTETGRREGGGREHTQSGSAPRALSRDSSALSGPPVTLDGAENGTLFPPNAAAATPAGGRVVDGSAPAVSGFVCH